VRRELGGIAVPKEIEFVPSLPKTRSGKIMRRYIRAKAMGQDPGDLTTLESEGSLGPQQGNKKPPAQVGGLFALSPLRGRRCRCVPGARY
jgi:hypothetical protein